MFSKEILIVKPSTFETTILQYHKESMFNVMLKRINQWETEGKDIHILDVRDSVYEIKSN